MERIACQPMDRNRDEKMGGAPHKGAKYGILETEWSPLENIGGRSL